MTDGPAPSPSPVSTNKKKRKRTNSYYMHPCGTPAVQRARINRGSREQVEKEIYNSSLLVCKTCRELKRCTSRKHALARHSRRLIGHESVFKNNTGINSKRRSFTSLSNSSIIVFFSRRGIASGEIDVEPLD